MLKLIVNVTDIDLLKIKILLKNPLFKWKNRPSEHIIISTTIS
jgi:hypothetical protein